MTADDRNRKQVHQNFLNTGKCHAKTDSRSLHDGAFAPRPGVPPLPSPSPYTTSLVGNVVRMRLDVGRVAHVHGGVDSWGTVLKAAGRSTTNSLFASFGI